jgi:hypothetical protein
MHADALADTPGIASMYREVPGALTQLPADGWGQLSARRISARCGGRRARNAARREGLPR